MRNILEYPITNEEIVDTLETLAKDLLSLHLTGDIRPACLLAAVDKLKALDDDKPPYYGDSDSPLGVAAFYEWQARRTGRTTHLVDNLPTGKVVIIVHSQRWANELKYVIQERRPELDVSQIQFISWDREAGAKLARLRCPIYFDNAVLDNESIRLVRDVNRVYGEKGTQYASKC